MLCSKPQQWEGRLGTWGRSDHHGPSSYPTGLPLPEAGPGAVSVALFWIGTAFLCPVCPEAGGSGSYGEFIMKTQISAPFSSYYRLLGGHI